MKRKLVILGIVLAAIVILSLFLFTHRDLLSQNPLQKDYPLEKVAVLKSDGLGNMYMIVDARESIIKLDSSGVCSYKIRSDSQQFSYLFNDLAIDASGNLYVLRTDLAPRGTYVVAENILRYTPSGDFSRVIHREEYQGDKRPMRFGHIKSLEVKDQSLFFHYIDGDRDVLQEFDLNGKSIRNQIVAYLPQNSYLAEITGIKPGAIFYSTQKGQLHNIGTAGDTALIYPNPTPGKPEASSSLPSNVPDQIPDRTFPTQPKYDGHNRLYFIDTFANEVKCLQTSEPYQCTTVFSQATLNEQGVQDQLSVLKDIMVEEDGSITVVLLDRIFKLDVQGKIVQVIDKITYHNNTIMLRWLVWASVLLILFLLFFIIRFAYVYILRRRISLIWKLIMVIAPIIIVGMVVLTIMIYKDLEAREEDAVYQELILLTHTGLNRINSDNLENITSPADYGNSDYRALRDLMIEAQIKKGRQVARRLDEEGLYTDIYKLEDGRLYCIVDYDNTVNMFQPIGIEAEFAKTLEAKQVIWNKNDDENGNWMFAMGPIFDHKGNIIGIFENGVDLSGFDREKDRLYNKIGRNIGFITLVIIIIFLLITYYQLLSLRKLRNSVTEIASGNWEVAVSLDTGDEVADLGDRVNDMAENIRNYIAEMTTLSEAYYRFVPQQFLSYLGKDNIIQVSLGDQVRQEMSILSTDIRSFYHLSENMSPEDNFKFLNSFLKKMGPFIRNNDGLIERYSGSGFVALFSRESEEALRAAIDMRRELIDYNAGRRRAGYLPIEIGIGIHQGPLMLGIIGEEKRMASTVISDNVNLAIALDRLTATLGAYILISESTLRAINNPERYLYRELGILRVEGKDEPVRFYDVFQADPDDIRKLKLETRELFQEGIRLYREGSFYDARSNFIEVIKRNRQDEIARIYFYLCEEYYKNGVPKGWDGTLLL